MHIVSNFEFGVNENQEVVLVKYLGGEERVVIPETVDGKPVRQIGMSKSGSIKGLTAKAPFDLHGTDATRPFAGNERIKVVIIPDTVHTINNFTFDGCSNLETVKLSKNLKEIPMYCFDQCENLKNIEFPNGIERIESYAFRSCANLESITLPESLIHLGTSAFMDCYELKEVKFPVKLQSIGEYAFNRCRKLTEIHLFENVESIGKRAFMYCVNVEKITLDAPKVKVGKNAFDVTDRLKEINFNAIKCLEIKQQVECFKTYIAPWETVENKKEVLAHITKKKTLQKEIFLGDDAEMIVFLMRAKVKISLQQINQYLEKSIKDEHTAVTAIYLEYKNTHFTQEEIEQTEEANELVEMGLEYPTLKQLKEKWKCSKLGEGIRISGYKGSNEKEVIPKQLADGTPIVMVAGSGGDAYKGLATIIIEEGIPEIGEKAFDQCKQLDEVVIPSSVQAIGKGAFGYSGITKIDLPDGIKIINHGTFTSCRKLETLVIPDSVEKIESLYMSPTFKSCENLKEVVLPKGTTTIPNSAFYECTALETIKNTENITKIDSYAFFGCTQLEPFQLGDVKIGTNALWDCKQWANNIGLIIINDTMIDTLDHTPKEIEVPAHVKIIGEDAFSGASSLERVVLPDGLLEIKKGAFLRCMNLCEINIPSSVKTIGTDAFSYAVSLEEIDIPKTTKVMKAFGNCGTLVNRV